MSDRTDRPAIRAALLATSLYMALAMTWVAVSDRAVEQMAETPAQRLIGNTLLDWGLVMLTGIVLFILTYRLGGKLEASRRALAQDQERLELLAEHMIDVLWVVGPDRRYSYVSPSVENQRGMQPEELLRGGLEFSVDDPSRRQIMDWLDRAEKEVAERARRGEPALSRGSFETTVCRSDRSQFPAEIRYTALGDKNGKLTGFVGVTRDISAQKHTEEALRRQTDRARQYLSLAPVLFVGLDPHLRTTMVNRKTCDLLGRDENEILGKNFPASFVPERERDGVLEYADALRRGTVEAVEYHENHLLTAGGEERLIGWHNVVFYDDEGKVQGLLSAGEDITESRRAREALKRSEATRRALLDALPEITVLIQADGTVLAANEALCRKLDMPAEEVVGKSAYDLIPPELAKSRRPYIEAVVASGKPVTFRDMNYGLHLENHLAPVFDDQGKVALIAIMARDVTSFVKAQEAREEAEKRLAKQRSLAMGADRLRSLGEMAAGIAHELNQPLVGVRGLAEHMQIAIERGWELKTDDLADNLQRIVDQADRMSHIVEHVRMFSREANRTELLDVSVNEVVESSIGLIGTQFRTHGIEIQVDTAADLPQVCSNPFSLEEVLLNLLANARDAVAPRLEDDDPPAPPQIRVGTWAQEDESGRQWVSIVVSDSGIGMEADVVSRAFDPFFTTKGPDSGTGLGLAIARSIVEDAGGRIRLDSIPGRGTTISMELPALGSACDKDDDGDG